MEFKELLKSIRENNKESLREMATKIGVAHSYIDRIEKGQTTPSETVIKALFKVYPAYKSRIAKAYVPTKIAPFILEEIEEDELDKILVILQMLEVEEQKIILKSILEKVENKAYKSGNIEDIKDLLEEIQDRIERL